ncbi:MAG: pilus assembly protein PilM, partial [Desulfococcaceae bacterium]
MLLFQTSIGLDIRPDRIAVVCLKKNLKGVRLIHHSMFNLKTENSYGDRLEGFVDWFEAFLKENHSIGRGIPEIFLGIPREMAVTKKIQLPLAAKENLHSAVRFDLEKHVPLSEEEVCFDCHILEEDRTENQLHILLVIVRKRDIMLYLEEMGSLGR